MILQKQRARAAIFGLAALSLVAGGVLAACGDDDNTATATSAPPNTATAKTGESSPSAAASQSNAIEVDAFELGYKVSGPLKPGTATVTFKDTGTISHMMATIRVKDGTTDDQVKAAVASNDNEALLALVADPNETPDYGTPALLSAGQSTTVTMTNLKPGTYAIMCFVPIAGGQPHAALGMVSSFKVSGDTVSTTPKDDGTISIADDKFTFPQNFTGKGTFKVTNTGDAPHSLTFAKLDSGTSVLDYFQYVEGKFNEPGPIDGGGGTLVAGVDELQPGQTAYLTLNLPAGHYGYLSTSGGDDPESQPDALNGLSGEFDVK